MQGISLSVRAWCLHTFPFAFDLIDCTHLENYFGQLLFLRYFTWGYFINFNTFKHFYYIAQFTDLLNGFKNLHMLRITPCTVTVKHYEFWQMPSVIYPSLWYHTQEFSTLKTPCASTVLSSLPWTPGKLICLLFLCLPFPKHLINGVTYLVVLSYWLNTLSNIYLRYLILAMHRFSLFKYINLARVLWALLTLSKN